MVPKDLTIEYHIRKFLSTKIKSINIAIFLILFLKNAANKGILTSSVFLLIILQRIHYAENGVL